jgi:hypothetical protein
MARSSKELRPEAKLNLQVEWISQPLADRRKIQAVLLHRSEKKNTLNATAKKLKVSRRTVSNWLKKYDTDGLRGLRKTPRGHRKGIFPRGKVGVLRKAIDSFAYPSVGCVREWLEKWTNSDVSLSAARYWRRVALQSRKKSARKSLGLLKAPSLSSAQTSAAPITNNCVDF